MFGRCLLVAVLLSAAGCPRQGPAPVPLLENQASSGSRLRARFVRGESLRLFLGWHDRARGEDCRFLPAGDGVLRCLPTSPGNGYLTGYFADDQCTVPAAVLSGLDPCAPAAPIAWLQLGTGECAARFAVHALEEEVPAVYAWSGTTCISTGQPGRRLGAEVPPAAFVAAHRELVPASPALSVSRLVAEDGATGEQLLADAAEGWTCYPSPALGGERCLPLATTYALHFGDPACTALAVYPPACPGTTHVYRYEPDTGAYSVHVPGAAASAYAAGPGATCNLVDGNPDAAQLLGPPLPPDRFAAGTPGSEGDRLRIDVFRFPGVELPASWTIPRDGPRDLCLPHHAADGVLRCMPPTAGAATVLPWLLARPGGPFADEACTQPLYPANASAIGVLDEPPACPRRVRAYAPGMPHAGPVYMSQPGGCVPALGFDGLALLGEEIPPAHFVPMVLE